MKSLVIFIVLIFVSTVFLTTMSAHGSENVTVNLRALTPHDPIRINSNDDLYNSGFPGDGTPENPYLIKDYDISASFAGAGIYIGNTSLYVLIDHCNIYGATQHSSSYADGSGIILYQAPFVTVKNITLSINEIRGIKLLDTNNDYLDNITIRDGSYGVFLSAVNHVIVNNVHVDNVSDLGIYVGGYNITIANSTIRDIEAGIGVTSSNNITIENNLLKNNTDHVYIGDSKDCYVINNTFLYAQEGSAIYLEEVTNTTLIDNRMTKSGIALDGEFESYTTQHMLNNTINGREVYYYNNINMNNASVPANAGQVILGNVSNLKLENLNLSDGYSGVISGYSSYIKITNSSLLNNYYSAIYFTYTQNSSIINNTIKGDTMLFNSPNTTILKNSMQYGGEGVLMSHSSYSVISNNSLMHYSQAGIEAYYSSHLVVDNNTCAFNNADGLRIYLSDWNYVHHNICKNNTGEGIVMQGVTNSRWMHNVMSGNYYGLYIGKINGISSTHNLIVQNLFVNNTNYGLFLSVGSYNLIYNNSFYYNHGSNNTYNTSCVQATDYGLNNSWNSTTGYGNYWADWAENNDTNDQNAPYGIVDWPYKLDGGAGVKDNYPLKSTDVPIPELGAVVWVLVALVGMIVILHRRKE